MQVNDRYDRICISMSIKGILSICVFVILLSFQFPISSALLGIVTVALITFGLDVLWSLPLTKCIIEFDNETSILIDNNKDYTLADSIRNELLSKGITLKDTREGTTYEVKK